VIGSSTDQDTSGFVSGADLAGVGADVDGVHAFDPERPIAPARPREDILEVRRVFFAKTFTHELTILQMIFYRIESWATSTSPGSAVPAASCLARIACKTSR
jgi:hypothetical protein